MSQRPGTPFDNPMGSMMDIIHGNPAPIVKGRKDTMADAGHRKSNRQRNKDGR